MGQAILPAAAFQAALSGPAQRRLKAGGRQDCLPHCILSVVKFSWTALLAIQLAAAQSLDFEFYRTRVEPIFLKKRPERTRCVVCHSSGRRAFNLQPLAAGSAKWTAEQTRLNFENASKLVVPGNPGASPLLIHPLARDAGGDRFHSGGRQFRSKDDPDWKIIEEWVRKAR